MWQGCSGQGGWFSLYVGGICITQYMNLFVLLVPKMTDPGETVDACRVVVEEQQLQG